MTGLYRAVIDAHAAGDCALARSIFHQMLPVLAFTRQHLDISIHFCKRLFYRRGIFSTTVVRKERRPYDSYHECYGDELIEYLNSVEAGIGGRRRKNQSNENYRNATQSVPIAEPSSTAVFKARGSSALF
jgi:4-hydroxy-tetrahydrodipicolinate synthase